MRRLPLGIVVAIALLVLYFNFSVFDSRCHAAPRQLSPPSTTAPATAAATFAAVTAPPRPAGPPMPGVLVALTKTVYRFVDERSYDCPALRGGKCDFTTLRSRFGEADAIIDVLKDPRKVKPLDFRKAKHQQLGVIISEQDKAKAGNTLFKRNGYDFEIGYNNKTADIWRPFMCNELSRKTNVTILEHLLKGPRVRPKLVDGIAAFVSNCVPWRLALLRELRKHVRSTVRLPREQQDALRARQVRQGRSRRLSLRLRAGEYPREPLRHREGVHRPGPAPCRSATARRDPRASRLQSRSTDFGGDGARSSPPPVPAAQPHGVGQYQQWDLAEFGARKAARQCPGSAAQQILKEAGRGRRQDESSKAF